MVKLVQHGVFVGFKFWRVCVCLGGSWLLFLLLHVNAIMAQIRAMFFFTPAVCVCLCVCMQVFKKSHLLCWRPRRSFVEQWIQCRPIIFCRIKERDLRDLFPCYVQARFGGLWGGGRFEDAGTIKLKKFKGCQSSEQRGFSPYPPNANRENLPICVSLGDRKLAPQLTSSFCWPSLLLRCWISCSWFPFSLWGKWGKKWDSHPLTTPNLPPYLGVLCPASTAQLSSWPIYCGNFCSWNRQT